MKVLLRSKKEKLWRREKPAIYKLNPLDPKLLQHARKYRFTQDRDLEWGWVNPWEVVENLRNMGFEDMNHPELLFNNYGDLFFDSPYGELIYHWISDDWWSVEPLPPTSREYTLNMRVPAGWAENIVELAREGISHVDMVSVGLMYGHLSGRMVPLYRKGKMWKPDKK